VRYRGFWASSLDWLPSESVEDYKEACLVLSNSPKASAALSRRCLQLLLRTTAGVKPGDLSNEIQEVLEGKTLPSGLAETIDMVRIFGNFAAHPIKSKSTGEVVPEPANHPSLPSFLPPAPENDNWTESGFCTRFIEAVYITPSTGAACCMTLAIFDDDSRLLQRAKYFPVQAFIPQLPFEAFAVAVLPGTSWLDVERPGAQLRPLLNHP
jgi:hypothetical protein